MRSAPAQRDAAAERADRRQTLAEALAGSADAETVDARLLADANQALPPAAAVAKPPPGAASAARPGRGADVPKQIGR